ncbi:MAG: L,D-transpeptidase family protein, partial [Pseudomonadota bacterium]
AWRRRKAPRESDLVVSRWGARFMGRHIPCAIGRNGIASDKREGDLGTPVGRFRLCNVFWRPDRMSAPVTILPARVLDHRQGWSEAPADPAYNRPIRHPHPFPADRMRRGDSLYDLCVVTDQNTDPVVPGAGSAIFLHLWRKPRHPTAGCVAFRRRDLVWILRHWTPASRLIIRAP